MRVLFALTTLLALTSSISHIHIHASEQVTQTQAQTQASVNTDAAAAASSSSLSAAFSRLAADVAAATQTEVATATEPRTEAASALVDPSTTTPIVIAPSPSTLIISCPMCILPKADLVPHLTVSPADSAVVYPPQSLYIKNEGTVASTPTTAKLTCVVWSTYPAKIIPNGIAYDQNGDGHGLCHSDISIVVPAIEPGKYFVPNLPFNPFALLCRKPAGMCDIHLKVEVANEWISSNNEVVVTKTSVASNAPWWP